ncbi:Uncharacterised protein [Bordetella pertussis]|nr:Uncharacterised protein [Bordetella pertussis]CFN12183.1 Uncharacterised protein [Bordetella pertussis]CFO06732.1 Uncharacterised protein [Bordetella pertussis]CFO64436.1 Uncharacterised protein [Bordetella pertussis]CFU64821.1 Uncharacterised protein [Bordetella pertussis]
MVPGLGEDAFGRPLLHLVATIHHQHAVGHFGDHAHVVGDEHDAHAHFLLQLADQLQDLRLDRDIQRRGRLVGDQQRGLAGQRHGDHHALAHAAGKLVRMTVHDRPRLGNAHLLEHAQRLGARGRGVLALVQPDGFGNLLAGGEHRVQRGHRLLENHGHVGAAYAAHGPLRRRAQVDDVAVAAAQRDAPLGDASAAMLDQAHQRQRGHRFARAGFAHDGQGLAPVDVKGQVAHRFHGAFGADETHRQVLDLNHAVLRHRQAVCAINHISIPVLYYPGRLRAPYR